MKTGRLITGLAILLSVSGCSEEDTRCGCGDGALVSPNIVVATPPFSGAHVQVLADRDPVVGGMATLTIRYEFDYHESLCDTVTLIAQGGVVDRGTDLWSYVSGDSSFVDTVRCFETREHSVVLRFHRKGQLLVDGIVGALIDSTFAIGGGDTVCLCVR